ncbi:MAG: hypothetical protein KDE33_15710, partial [Bacteroidetes bacterium]|nr:hypothetical protein [Bacteroidota bacterium]
SSLIKQFIGLGLNKQRIENLFGITEEIDFEIILKNIINETNGKLINSEQVAFVILYHKIQDNKDYNDDGVFYVQDVNGEWQYLYTHYIEQFSFIEPSKCLNKCYNSLRVILKLDEKNLVFPNGYEDILLKPLFRQNEFKCPYLKNEKNDTIKTDFFEYVFGEWSINKDIVANANLSPFFIFKYSPEHKTKPNQIEFPFGFNPATSVYPSKYACESEVLPDYLIKWIGKEEAKIDFLSDLGVWTENSVVVEFRKYLSDKIKDFHKNRLSQETRFNDDEENLFNSFVWLKEKEITLKTAEQFETFKKAVDVINENRTNTGDLEIKEEFDFEELEENATEWEESYYENWKEDSDVAIYLYEGELPKTISLDEIEDFVFYYFYEGNTAIDYKNNIYVNRNADVKKELRKLELENDNFNFDGLWQNKLEVLEKENAKLRRANEATLGTEFSTDISKNDQKEANREAKEIVKEKLEREGFEFTEGIGKYSTIHGVFKNDVEFPLVVKSYKYQDEPLKIGANEWIQLMRPNSMFWVHFGNRKLGCLKLYELLRNQDKLTISFSTENLDVEDRLEKFAELLHYFGNVHFDFNSVKPSDYSVAKDLNDYRFDERRNEEDLSGDDESIL